jgi:ABC-2 type transport system permease protein
MRLFTHQLRAEQLIFWRSRESAIFIFIFPLLLFLLLGAIYGDDISRGVPVKNLLVSGMIGYGCANTAFAGLAITLVLRREQAILKRLRTTPLPAGTYVAAVLGSTMVVFALQTAGILAIGDVVYDTKFPPPRIMSLIALVVIGAVAFACMGVGLASLIRSAEGASAVVNVILLPMAFLTGSFGPTHQFPRVLRAIGAVLPLKPFIELVETVYIRGHAIWSRPGSLGVLAAWAAVGLVVALRRFSWAPVQGG